MFFFQIDFNDGRAHEYQASNEQAVHWVTHCVLESASYPRTAPISEEFTANATRPIQLNLDLTKIPVMNA